MRIAICDNKMEVVKEIQDLIFNILGNEVQIAKHYNPFSLLTYIIDEVKGDLDLLIIKIELPNQDGIKVAESIIEQFPNVKIIFVSSLIERVKDIFKINPIYFIFYPIEMKYIRDALYKAQKLVDEEKQARYCLKVKTSNGVAKYKYHDIYHIESEKRVVHIYTTNLIETVYIKLDELENELSNNFLRCHQSYIVNIDKIKNYNREYIDLFNGMKIPVSRSKSKEVQNTINGYFSIIND